MNTARLWLGRQWGSERLAKRLDRQTGSAHDAGRGDGVARPPPREGADARAAGRDDAFAAARELGSEL